MTDLGTLGRVYTDSNAAEINDSGQIAVGTSATADGGIGKRHLVVARSGRISDLGTLGGGFYEAVAINQRGQIIAGPIRGAAPWCIPSCSQNGKTTDLGTLGGAERRVGDQRAQPDRWYQQLYRRRHAACRSVDGAAPGYLRQAPGSRSAPLVGWKRVPTRSFVSRPDPRLAVTASARVARANSCECRRLFCG
jgi:hypothetical protein